MTLRKKTEEEKQTWRNFATPIIANIAYWAAIIAFVISIIALKIVLGIYPRLQ